MLVHEMNTLQSALFNIISLISSVDSLIFYFFNFPLLSIHSPSPNSVGDFSFHFIPKNPQKLCVSSVSRIPFTLFCFFSSFLFLFEHLFCLSLQILMPNDKDKVKLAATEKRKADDIEQIKDLKKVKLQLSLLYHQPSVSQPHKTNVVKFEFIFVPKDLWSPS